MNDTEADRVASALERIEDQLEKPDRLARTCNQVVAVAERIFVNRYGTVPDRENASDSLEAALVFVKTANAFVKHHASELNKL